MKTKCQGLAGFLFGHKFEPRYDYEEGPSPAYSHMKGVYPEILDALKPKKKIYVHDVCRRCGEIVKREEQAL